MCSSQFRVLGFGFFQYRNVGVGVFPEREEILMRGAPVTMFTPSYSMRLRFGYRVG
jgi:hypothetical protein